MAMNEQLKGKVAIVTGAGRGLGKCIVLALAEQGANVVLVSRSQSDLDAVSKEAGTFKVKSLPIRTDVSQETEVNRMVEQTLATFNRIDILFNNAAISGPTDFVTDIKTEDWDNVMNTNLKAYFLCARAVIPQMIKQREGNIINMTSGAGSLTKDQSFLTPTRSLVYSVSKFGVEGFTKALAGQLNQFNINVNALSPSPTETGVKHVNAPPAKKAIVRRPEQIKKVAVFMAVQGRNGITAETVYAPTWDKIYLTRELDA
jgi:3-oxoacyl-[acyl-carrier protein] reductase